MYGQASIQLAVYHTLITVIAYNVVRHVGAMTAPPHPRTPYLFH